LNELQTKWREGRCPLVRGIIHGDGRVTTVRVSFVDPDDASSYTLVIDDIADIECDKQKNEGDWIAFSEFYEVSDYRRALRVGCGETSFESEGFVAVSHPPSGELIWLALIDGAGPFFECRLGSDVISVRSEHDVWWHFPLGFPERLVIDSAYRE
jgi:hypothetical protein